MLFTIILEVTSPRFYRGGHLYLLPTDQPELTEISSNNGAFLYMPRIELAMQAAELLISHIEYSYKVTLNNALTGSYTIEVNGKEYSITN